MNAQIGTYLMQAGEKADVLSASRRLICTVQVHSAGVEIWTRRLDNGRVVDEQIFVCSWMQLADASSNILVDMIERQHKMAVEKWRAAGR